MDVIPGDAFCLLLFLHNGGVVDQKGKPILQACPYCQGSGRQTVEDDCSQCAGTGHDNRRVRGYCGQAGDCASCPELQMEIAHYHPSLIHWFCTDCVSKAVALAKLASVKLTISGYYNEGLCQGPYCPREGSEQLQLPARYSPLLQLLIGPLPPWER